MVKDVLITHKDVYKPQYKLKYRLEDFQVNECYIIPQHLPKLNDHHLFLLQKAGFSTFDAIHSCADYFNIPKKNVTYFGLKDEDAITQQIICINMPDEYFFNKYIDEFNNKFSISDNSYINIKYLSKSPYQLAIGGLLSNAFSLTIRNLPIETISKLINKKILALTFINYYGNQRFGLPGKKANTHVIGEHILNGNFEEAFNLVKAQESRLSNIALKHMGSAREFFSNIDYREKNFFINSYYSFIWNQKVGSLLIKSQKDLINYVEKGISYLFPIGSLPAKSELISDNIIHYKTIAEKGEIEVQASYRPCLVQTFFNILEISPDEHFSNSYKVSVNFTLPTGTYATMAILQFLLYIDIGLL